MSIHLVTGPPGSGKSYHCVRLALESLESGKWLATNVEFHEGWQREFARANPFRRLSRKRVARFERDFTARAVCTHSLEELTLLRLPPCKKCTACRRGLRCMKEGRGVMLLDEAHNWLNARTWDADESGQSLSKAEAIANRLRIVRFFSQHRKLGWTVYLVTQDAAQLDAQVRRNFEYHVHLRNFRNFKVMGLRLFPMHLFTAITTWMDAEQSKVGARVYRLNKRIANLYDTTATSHGLDFNHPDAIFLGEDDLESARAKRKARLAEVKPATVTDVRSALRGRPAGSSLRCPSCALTLPLLPDDGQAPVGSRLEGVVLLRCPSCAHVSPLRPAPDPAGSVIWTPPGGWRGEARPAPARSDTFPSIPEPVSGPHISPDGPPRITGAMASDPDVSIHRVVSLGNDGTPSHDGLGAPINSRDSTALDDLRTE